ncbi:MAG: ATP-binding protein [Actinomycetota bacterium]
MEVASREPVAPDRPAPVISRIAAYVSAWGGMAILAALVLVFLGPDHDSGVFDVSVGVALLFFSVTAVADAVVLHLHHGKSREFINLVEAAIAVNILIFDASQALAITLTAVAFANLIHRRPPIKIAFNLAQYTVSTVVALMCFRLIAGTAHPLSARALFALGVGMVGFGAVNAVSVAGLVSRLEGRAFRLVLREGASLSGLMLFGNTAVGIVTAVVWQARPELAVLMLAPAVTLHLAYRGVVRSAELLETATAERDRLNRVVTGASDGIVLTDSDGAVVVWSPAMVSLTGIEQAAAQGQTVAEVLIGRDLSGNSLDPLAPLRTATPTSPIAVVEMVVTRPDDEERVVRAHHNTLFDSRLQCIGDAIIVHDVTHDHEIERMKDDLLARVSHELRTPLTPIKGYAQALLRKIDNVPPDLMKEALTQIVERVDHMTLLIDDLLLVSRIMAGNASVDDQLRPDAFDLPELCRKVVTPFQSMEPERDFELEVDDGFPMVVADPMRVEQIVANLVSNACKYSPKGEPIQISIGHNGAWASIRVADRGRGVPDDQLEKIFERFYRTENPMTMTTGGIGLGLHITRELARAMGGTLTAESRLGEGSTFTLKLPLPDSGASA